MSYGLGSVNGLINLRYTGGPAVRKAATDVGGLQKVFNAAGVSAGMLGKMATIGIGGAVVAGVIQATRVAAQFEKQLAQINAVSGATPKQMDAIRVKALQLGKDTAFSASDAASAIEELVKAGVSIPDTLNGAADAVVALAAAGGIELPQAATIASNAMNQFGLTAQQLGGVVDDIAGAANASAIDVGELGQSMQQVGAVAHLAGLSFHDTAVAIALMGNAGIRGSDAGTSLKTMLQNLIPQTKKQINLMTSLGLITKDGANRFFDAQGRVKSFAQVSEVLAKALQGQTTEQKLSTLQTIFGTDAIRAAAVAADAGAKGVNKMSTAMGKMTAADVAKKRMDNLAGSFEQLKGSIETGMILLGSPVVKVLRDIVDWLTNGVNALVDYGTAIGKEAAPGFRDLAAAVVSVIHLGGSILSFFSSSSGAASGLGESVMLSVDAFNLVANVIAHVASFLEANRDLVILVGGAWLLMANGGIAAVITRLGWFAAYAVVRALDGLSALWTGAEKAKTGMMGLSASAASAVASLGAMAVLMAAIKVWSAYRQAVRETAEALDAAARARNSGDLPSMKDEIKNLESLIRKRKQFIEGQKPKDLSDWFGFMAKGAIQTGEAAVKTFEYSRSMDDLQGSVKKTKKSLNDMVQGVLDVSTQVGHLDTAKANDLMNAFQEGDPKALEAINQQAKDLEPLLETAGFSAKQFMDALQGKGPISLDQIRNALAHLTPEQLRSKSAQESLTQAVANFQDETMSAADAADALKDALDRLVGVQLDADEAAIAWRDSLRSLQDQLSKTNGQINGGSKAADENRTAIISSARAMMDRVSAEAKAGVSIGKIVRQFGSERKALIQTAVQAGVNKKAMVDLLKQYNLTPKAARTLIQAVNADEAKSKMQDLQRQYNLTKDQVNTIVHLAGADDAISKVKALQQYIDGLHDKTITTYLRQITTHGSVAGGGHPTGYKGYRGGFTNAYGDLGLERYFSGGLRNLDPKIYNGRRVMFAEPGTGGEAFIPLASSKRSRSEMLLQQVAAIFGGAFVKFAEGGFMDLANAAPVGGSLASMSTTTTTVVQAPPSGGSRRNNLRLIEGKIGFDDSGQAFLRGIVEDVMDDSKHYDSTIGRMG